MKQSHTTLFLCIISFFSGSLWSRGWQQPAVQLVAGDCPPPSACHCTENNNNNNNNTNHTSSTLPAVDPKLTEAILQAREKQTSSRRFPPSLKNLVVGAARTPVRPFVDQFDTGIPLDESSVEDVLLLYSTGTALPAEMNGTHNTNSNELYHDDNLPKLSAARATSNCDLLNVVHVQQPDRELRQCLALVGHHVDSSIHSTTFLRVKPQRNNNGPQREVDPQERLRHVGQGVRANGEDRYAPPRPEDTQFHYNMMRVYLQHYDAVMQDVRRILERIMVVAHDDASQNDRTVVAIVTNRGYADLLLNFVCRARARGLDLSRVLVFATDQETKQLVEGLGLHVYYGEKIFESMPVESAEGFADSTWKKMVYAQGLCVQILSQLNYNFLLQDVDVFWYRNPLEYFRNQTADDDNEVDIYFMEDGARWRYYAPYGANTGFYYVRANGRTRHLFTNFLSLSDNTMQRNDQSVMNMLLHLHANQYGLHVKVINREEPLFLGGFQYLSRPEMMKQLMRGEIEPYTHHMHWSEPLDKRKYLRQMGLWHLHDSCSNVTEALHLAKKVNRSTTAAPLVRPCCSAEPLLQCFYRDVPSKEPCHDSPAKGRANAKSFWA